MQQLRRTCSMCSPVTRAEMGQLVRTSVGIIASGLHLLMLLMLMHSCYPLLRRRPSSPSPRARAQRPSGAVVSPALPGLFSSLAMVFQRVSICPGGAPAWRPRRRQKLPPILWSWDSDLIPILATVRYEQTHSATLTVSFAILHLSCKMDPPVQTAISERPERAPERWEREPVVSSY